MNKGDEFFKIVYEEIYDCEDTYYSLYVANSVIPIYFMKQDIVFDRYERFFFAKTKDAKEEDYIFDGEGCAKLYKTKEEAEKALIEKRIKDWEEIDGDKMLKALLKVKKELEK